MRISVIIPALNEAASIGAAIDTAAEADPMEIIVVDGGSADDTAGVVFQKSAYSELLAVQAVECAVDMLVSAERACSGTVAYGHAGHSTEDVARGTRRVGGPRAARHDRLSEGREPRLARTPQQEATAVHGCPATPPCGEGQGDRATGASGDRHRRDAGHDLALASAAGREEVRRQQETGAWPAPRDGGDPDGVHVYGDDLEP